MKNVLLIISILMLSYCTPDKLEIAKGKIVAENLLKDVANEKYSEVSKYYTKGFNEGEPIEKRTEKFKALRNAEGELVEYKLTDSLSEAKSMEESRLVLTYRVKYSKLTTKETFVIVYDEGEYKVANHSVVSENK